MYNQSRLTIDFAAKPGSFVHYGARQELGQLSEELEP